MSELPLLAFMLGSVYYFVKWMYHRVMYDLVLAAGFVFLASLIRYDAWFLIFIEFICILIIARKDRWQLRKVEGLILLFLTLALFGAVLWLGWSTIIFHDPFYFMNSPYSAKSQQVAFLSRGELPSYHNVIESVKLYSGAVVLNVGSILSIISAVGAIAYSLYGKATRSIKLIVVLLLVSPFLFNVLSLALGISILFVPGVTPDSFQYQLFNIRYGLLMIPASSIFIALLIGMLHPKILKVTVATIVFLSIGFFATTYPITLQDGVSGLSARYINGTSGVNNEFKKYYDHGFVAFDDFSRAADPIKLGVPMNKIIYVGSEPYWENMLARPYAYARWIIIRKDDALDRAFAVEPKFSDHYDMVYSHGDSTLYRCSQSCTGEAE